MSEHLSMQQLSVRYRVSRPTIMNYVSRGMPFVQEADRSKGIPWLFDAEACDLWIAEQEDEKQLQRLVELEQTEIESEADEDIKRERIRKLQVEIKILEQRYLERRGELIPVDEILDVVEAQYRKVRAQLLSLPQKLAPTLAVKTDVAEIDDIITDYVNDALSELVEDEVVPEAKEIVDDLDGLSNNAE